MWVAVLNLLSTNDDISASFLTVIVILMDILRLIFLVKNYRILTVQRSRIHLSMILQAKVLTLSKKSDTQNFGFVILLI